MNFKKVFGLLVVACVAWNCSDDSGTSTTGSNVPSSGSTTSTIIVKEEASFDEEHAILIYKDGTVTDIDGNVVGAFDAATGGVTMRDGVTFEIDINVLPVLKPGENTVPNNNAGAPSADSNGKSSESTGGNTSTGIGNSSASGTAPETPAASSSSGVHFTPAVGGFKDIKDYGEPSAEYTKDISGAKRGWNTRYWDACKAHCSWISNGEEGKTDTTTQESYVKGMTTARNCNIHDVEVPTFTLGHNVQQYWKGYEGTTSACDVGEKGVFTCTDMAPIAVNEKLSYAYVAGTADGSCGKCYHLQYDGHFKDESATNAPKATHKALAGKHIIVMASNIGKDVAGGDGDLAAGQFDLMVPGGGVGIFDALSIQVKTPANFDWGEQYGGFLTRCQQKLGYDKGLKDYQDCIHEMCDAAFKNSGYDNLYRGCNWFADWYMAADNPTYYIEEVECPQYLIDHYLTTINTTKTNSYKWHDDWSTYNGEKLEEMNCWEAGQDPQDPYNPNAGCR